MDDLLSDFAVETLDSIDSLDAEIVRLERDPSDAAAIERIFRVVHTIKGTCGFINLRRLERISHALENRISIFRDGATPDRAAVNAVFATLDRIRVIARAIETVGVEPAGDDEDLLSALVQEGIGATGRPSQGGHRSFETGSLVYQVLERPLREGEVTLDDLERAFRQAPGPEGATGTPGGPAAGANHSASTAKARVRVAVERLDHLIDVVSELVLIRNQLLDLSRKDGSGAYKLPLQRLSNITGELQDGVMQTRMQAISTAWAGLPRTVRDLALSLGKDIVLETSGDDTEIDRQLLEIIKDSLVHLVRNAADHGIELPAERIAADKAPTGIIRLSAGRERGQIVVRIEDDGRGLDPDALRQRAVARGLLDEAESRALGDSEAALLIFRPGFSTASAVTSVSGRGVGLDAVRDSVEQAGGTIELLNRPGHGLAVILKLPLTLAIANVLIVESAGQRFALPQLAVTELVRTQADSDVRVEMIGTTLTLRLRDGLLPLIRLDQALGREAQDAPAGVVAICQAGHVRFGLALGIILQTEEIVVKPLPGALRSIPYYSGTTILGDGSAVLILEPAGFARLVEGAGASAPPVPESRPETERQAAKTAVLVFRGHDGREKAVPLSLVKRLEDFSPQDVERLGGRQVVQYRGGVMHLLGEPGLPEQAEREDRMPVIVFSCGRETVGVVVQEIVDIVEDRFELDLAHASPGWLGTAIIGGRLMEVLDVAALFAAGAAVVPEIPGHGPPRVLLVEPSAFFQAMLAPLLRAVGLDVTIASNADEALALAEANRFAVAIVDFDGAVSRAGELCMALRPDLKAPALV
ncbi:MAG TPA: chemotaxis protein CheA, partial [Beijerinckiaceae bacterium]|nr:chemotaxis protein CheA [Beijerinckiaceae bacterium]